MDQPGWPPPAHPVTVELARRLRIPVRRRYRGERERALLSAEQDRLLAELARLDEHLVELARTRLATSRAANHIHDLLWPRVEEWHGRRPPRADTRPLPPVLPGADRVAGARLRVAALALLHRLGPVSLPDLHAALHLHGYEIAAHHPVKTLADALAHEVRAGRARREARGVYAPVRDGGDATTASPPVDRWLSESPGRWPDPPPTAA